MNMRVHVLEKRDVFSRVNILMLWQPTADDLVAFGARCAPRADRTRVDRTQSVAFAVVCSRPELILSCHSVLPQVHQPQHR